MLIRGYSCAPTNIVTACRCGSPLCRQRHYPAEQQSEWDASLPLLPPPRPAAHRAFGVPRPQLYYLRTRQTEHVTLPATRLSPPCHFFVALTSRPQNKRPRHLPQPPPRHRHRQQHSSPKPYRATVGWTAEARIAEAWPSWPGTAGVRRSAARSSGDRCWRRLLPAPLRAAGDSPRSRHCCRPPRPTTGGGGVPR